MMDIFCRVQIDYDRNAPVTGDSLPWCRNKFHYAITGQTAAEIVLQGRLHQGAHGANHSEVRTRGACLKSDVSIAKINFQSEKQIR